MIDLVQTINWWHKRKKKRFDLFPISKYNKESFDSNLQGQWFGNLFTWHDTKVALLKLVVW